MRRGAALKISIIIPTLNEGGVIGHLLQQLQPARQAGHEVIVVDGGSSDGTVERARPLADRVLCTRPGRGEQLNRGALASSGGWLWFLHADSRLPRDWLAQLEGACREGQRHWGFFQVRLDGDRLAYRVIAGLMNARSCLTRIATGDQGVFVRRELFFAGGCFPAIPIMEDVALGKRLRCLPPCCLPGPLVTSARRWEREGLMRTVLRMWALRLAFWLGVSPHRLQRHYSRCTTPDTES